MIGEPNVELLDLQVFNRVVELGGFTAAAEVLGLPKSSVSRRIAALEDRLGVRLLQRTTRRINLTDAGRLYHAHVQRILAEVRDAQAALDALHGRPTGELRITLPLELGNMLINQLLLDFMQQYPEINLTVEHSNRIVDLIAEGFDLAIRASHLPLDDSSLVARRLSASRFALYGAPTYFAAHGRPQHPDDLAGHTCLSHSAAEPGRIWELLDGAGKTYRIKVSGSLTCNSFDMLAAAAERGLGIALLPETQVTDALANGRLTSCLEPYIARTGQIYALYPSRRYLPPKVSVLLDFLNSRLRD